MKSRKLVTRKVGRYEVGRTIGEGTFAKVKFAQNIETGESVAMKVLDKGTVLRNRMADQIKREISIMKIVRHPNIVCLREVLASRTKIYIILEFVTGGELFDKIVLGRNGYDGAAADIWSCGVILYVLMAGYLPFDEADLTSLYRKINAADFSCPNWFSADARSLISRILDPDPQTRIKITEIRANEWFKNNYMPVRLYEDENVNLDDVRALFDDAEKQYVSEQIEEKDTGPLMMNAFELITLSQGLNLSALFDRRQDYVKRQTRFISRKPAKVIISKMESAAASLGFRIQTRNYKMRLEGLTSNKTGQIAVALEVFEVAPSVFMVEVRKAVGDTLEYHKFYKNFCALLADIIWKPVREAEKSVQG